MFAKQTLRHAEEIVQYLASRFLCSLFFVVVSGYAFAVEWIQIKLRMIQLCIYVRQFISTLCLTTIVCVFFILIVIQFSFSFSFRSSCCSLFFLLLQIFSFFIYSKKTYWLNFHRNIYIMKEMKHFFYWEIMDVFIWQLFKIFMFEWIIIHNKNYEISEEIQSVPKILLQYQAANHNPLCDDERKGVK